MAVKASIDWLSFSWRPAALHALMDLAKQHSYITTPETKAAIDALREDKGDFCVDELMSGAGWLESHWCFKTLPDYAFDAVKHEVAIARFIDLLRDEVGQLTVDLEADFRTCYEVMLQDCGIGALEELCASEISRFVDLMNQLSPDAYTWSYKVNNGGKNYYQHSADLYCNDAKAGVLCWGARNYGCMVSFSGEGCKAVDWPAFHKQFAQYAEKGHMAITRVDVACDDFEGNWSVDKAIEMADNGGFQGRGRHPDCSLIEGWAYVTDSGRKTVHRKSKGRTFYVGQRSSGKMMRVYEKGLQLTKGGKDPHPDVPESWVRWELELRNVDRVIPFDVLLNPGQYAAGAYPVMAEIMADCPPNRIRTFKANYRISADNLIRYARTAYGPLLRWMQNVGQYSPAQAVEILTQGLDDFAVPRRLAQNPPIEVLSC